LKNSHKKSNMKTAQKELKAKEKAAQKTETEKKV
jgi:hypothetical protein